MLKSQGTNILLNMFFGTVINAAFGVAGHLESTLRAFSKNFLTALNPQITKSYSEGDISRSKTSVYNGSKYAFLLLFVCGLPIMVETDTVLHIWPKKVPPYSALFTKLIIILPLIESLLSPINTINQATADIKWFQIITFCTQILILPVCYLLLNSGCNPYTTLYSAIAAELLTLPIRVQINKKHVGITISEFGRNVLLRLISVIIASIAFGMMLKQIIPQSL